MPEQRSGLLRMMQPKSIAVIGASADGKRINGRPLRYLREFGFDGKLYAVNPNYRDIGGVPCFPDIGSLPRDVDLAVCMLSSAQVLPAVQAAGRQGVGAMVVMASGFAEAGAEGRARQGELAATARSLGIRLLGPNTLGYRDQRRGIYATFATDLDSRRLAGRVAIITQSGGLGGYFGGAQLTDLGVGAGYLIDTGNEADIDAAECLEAVCRDPDVSVIGLILEGCRSGRRLLDACLAARERGIPVVLFKVGTSAAGAQSVALHTGSLAGELQVWDAALQAAGVLRARDEAQFLDLLHLLDSGRRPRGKGVGVVTLSGGVATVILDASDALGLSMPAVRPADPALQAKMPLTHFGNPLDASGSMANTPELLDPLLQHMLDHDEIDVVVVWLAYALLSPIVGPPMADAVIAAARRTSKPVVICGMAMPELRDRLRAAGVPVLAFPTRAIEALAMAVQLNEPTALSRPVVDWSPPQQTSETIHTGLQAQRLLSALPFAQTHEVRSAAHASEVASQLGFPVALKVEAEGLVHKSELGVIRLGLRHAADVAAAFDDLEAVGARHGLKGQIVCQPQLSGVEVFAGAKLDQVFGPVVMVGLGGIFVELFRDVAMLLAPAEPARVVAALRRLKGFPVLDGARGRALVDIDALAETVAALSRLISERNDITEIDVNPIILPPGRNAGALAVDAVVRTLNARD
ncbi:acetate--CoA ligase family protein [Bradyrhizobium sp. LHD-71]|uniref:acetate--CoA ligase family protein n=1 Tax=Bradyrhizobium sp. LHD-71 TaxID=3072141 RepID=UPI00281033E8|nr:acetate--CoA ligase family protein [Bradyrhizobium sp. LHD-71]MDQ8728195.1 acetate--CoA ligase family protein [Bradyrhizobium sp. LHD-71]